MAKKSLPYVTAALLSEKVLQEQDGSISIVRIADRLQYRVEGLPPDKKPMVQVHGFVSIKSGPVTGDHTLKIVSERPNGERRDLHTQPIKLLGKDHGVNLIINMGIGIEQDGLYWFDVFFDDELLSRIPLVITPLPKQESGESESP